MPAHSSARAQLTYEWLTKADGSMRVAERLATAPSELHDAVVLHCREAVERALKAYLAWQDLPYRRVYHLAELLSQCVAVDAGLARLSDAVDVLAPYAPDPRYPGPPPGLDPLTPEAALAFAGEVMRQVLTRVPAEVHP